MPEAAPPLTGIREKMLPETAYRPAAAVCRFKRTHVIQIATRKQPTRHWRGLLQKGAGAHTGLECQYLALVLAGHGLDGRWQPVPAYLAA